MTLERVKHDVATENKQTKKTKAQLKLGYTGNELIQIRSTDGRDFTIGQEVKTSCFTAGGTGSIPGQGTKIPHTMWGGQKSPQNQKNKLRTVCYSLYGI